MWTLKHLRFFGHLPWPTDFALLGIQVAWETSWARARARQVGYIWVVLGERRCPWFGLTGTSTGTPSVGVSVFHTAYEYSTRQVPEVGREGCDSKWQPNEELPNGAVVSEIWRCRYFRFDVRKTVRFLGNSQIHCEKHGPIVSKRGPGPSIHCEERVRFYDPPQSSAKGECKSLTPYATIV